MHAQLIANLLENKRQRQIESSGSNISSSSSSQCTTNENSSSQISLRDQIIAQNELKPLQHIINNQHKTNGSRLQPTGRDLKDKESDVCQLVSGNSNNSITSKIQEVCLGNRSSPIVTRASVAKLQTSTSSTVNTNDNNKRKISETTTTNVGKVPSSVTAVKVKDEVAQPSRKKTSQKCTNEEPTTTANSTSSISSTTTVVNGGGGRQFTCLRNMGTTCYINCILQVLRYTPGFTQSIHRLYKKIEYLKLISKEIDNELNQHYDVAVVRSLHEILVDMAKEEKKEKTTQRTSAPIITPRKFVRAVWKSLTIRDINWADGSQQDAHEFLQYVIHFINECDVFVRRTLQKYQPQSVAAVASQLTHSEINNTRFNLMNNDESSTSSESSNTSSTVASTITISSSSGSSSLSQRSTRRGLAAATAATAATEGRQKRDQTGLYAFTKGGSRDNMDSSSSTSSSTQDSTAASSSGLVLVDDKDLITQRMKAIVSNAGGVVSSINSGTRAKPKSESSCKRPKLDDWRSLDDNSFIIIDSDDDDDVIEEEEEANGEIDISNSQSTSHMKELSLNQSSSPPALKGCQVYLEKISTDEDVVKEKFGVRLSQSPPKDSQQSATPAVTTAPPSVVETEESAPKCESKRLTLRTRSKTFPQQVKKPGVKGEHEEDFDAIVAISMSTRSSNNNSETTTATNVSRLSTIHDTPERELRGDRRVSTSPLKTAAIPVATATASSVAAGCINNSVFSPAELLRKTSSSTGGFTCELDKLFRGSSVTVTQCLECENLRKCPESFYDRCIPIDTCPDDDDADETTLSNKKKQAASSSSSRLNWISKCLSNVSYLNENSKYMCDVCNSKQEAMIRTQYTHVPDVLILHLMSYGIISSVDGNLNTQKLNARFRLVKEFDVVCQTGGGGSAAPRDNLNLNYQFAQSPVTVRNGSSSSSGRGGKGDGGVVESKLKFRLFAVVMHNGDTLNSGHYTAIVNMSIAKKAANERKSMLEVSKNFELDSESNNKCQCLLEDDVTTTSGDQQFEWLHFDDTKVKGLSDAEFQRKITTDSSFDSPYILFYVKEEPPHS